MFSTAHAARHYLTEMAHHIPEDQRGVYLTAIDRLRKKFHTKKAGNRALPLDDAKKALIHSMLGSFDDFRIADLAEATGCSHHDISVYLNNSRP